MEKGITNKKPEINKVLFIVPVIVLVILIIWGVLDNSSFGNFVVGAKYWILKYFGSWLTVCGFVAFVFSLILMFSPAGKIRIGGENAKPEFSKLRWFAMTLCAGIGVGIVFWGVAEPLYFYMDTPTSLFGIEAETPQAGVWALSQAYIHWAFVPYAFNCVLGVAIAHMSYNLDQPFRISTTLYPLLGERVNGPVGTGINLVCIVTYIIGVVPSVGFATQQIGAGLEYQYGIPANILTYSVLIIIITIAFSAGSYGGIKRVISRVSNLNFWIYVGLMIFIVLTCNGLFILAIGVEAFGDFTARVIPDILITDPFNTGEGWIGDWTQWYWTWWLCGAPVIGMFVAKIAKGNTIRDFVMVNMIGAGVFAFIWFAIFGGTAIYQQHYGIADIWSDIQERGNPFALFSFFDSLPLSVITIPIFIICVFISFVTLAEAVTTSLATLTVKMSIDDSRNQEPPGKVKIIWGCLLGGFALVVLATGTADAISGAGAIGGLPILFLELACVAGLIKLFFMNKNNDKKQIASKEIEQEAEEE